MTLSCQGHRLWLDFYKKGEGDDDRKWRPCPNPEYGSKREWEKLWAQWRYIMRMDHIEHFAHLNGDPRFTDVARFESPGLRESELVR